MAVVICLNRFLAPVDDTVTAHLKTQVTSHKPVWTVYPYLIVDASDNWDLNVSHFTGPDKFGKLGAPGRLVLGRGQRQ